MVSTRQGTWKGWDTMSELTGTKAPEKAVEKPKSAPKPLNLTAQIDNRMAAVSEAREFWAMKLKDTDKEDTRYDPLVNFSVESLLSTAHAIERFYLTGEYV